MSDPRLNGLMLSLVVLAVAALLWGGVSVWRGGDRRKGVLMLVAALVLLGNVLIWTV